MPHHKIEAEGDTYTITCDETIALELKSDARAKKFTTANITGVCDLTLILESQYLSMIPSFEYQPRKNKFVPTYPGIWPTKGLSVKNGDFGRVA